MLYLQLCGIDVRAIDIGDAKLAAQTSQFVDSSLQPNADCLECLYLVLVRGLRV